MSMNTKIPILERVRDLFKQQRGIVRTADLVAYGLPTTYLSILKKHGEVQQISRGVYSSGDHLADEMLLLQVRYKGAIFSHETALSLWELSDRTPLFYSVTVPTGYNATSLKADGAKVYFVNRALYRLGVITMKSSQEHEIKTFDLERTICDVLRSRNQLDVQFVSEALKGYVRKKERNIDLLYQYAGQFRIQKIVRQYLEVLL